MFCGKSCGWKNFVPHSTMLLKTESRKDSKIISTKCVKEELTWGFVPKKASQTQIQYRFRKTFLQSRIQHCRILIGCVIFGTVSSFARRDRHVGKCALRHAHRMIHVVIVKKSQTDVKLAFYNQHLRSKDLLIPSNVREHAHLCPHLTLFIDRQVTLLLFQCPV